MTTRLQKTARALKELPRDYPGLCNDYLPRPIHDADEHDEAQNAIVPMLGYEDRLTPGQSDYLQAVSTFIEQYEKQAVVWPQATPRALLKFLVTEHGMSGADLARLLGVNESMGGKILRGERNLTVEHIRQLSKEFSVSPELFID